MAGHIVPMAVSSGVVTAMGVVALVAVEASRHGPIVTMLVPILTAMDKGVAVARLTMTTDVNMSPRIIATLVAISIAHHQENALLSTTEANNSGLVLHLQDPMVAPVANLRDLTTETNDSGLVLQPQDPMVAPVASPQDLTQHPLPSPQTSSAHDANYWRRERDYGRHSDY